MPTQPPATPLTTAPLPDHNNQPAPPTNSLPLAPNPNGSPSPAPNRVPKARGWKRRSRWLVAVLVLLMAVGTSLGGWYFYTHRIAAHPNLLTHKIKHETMKITIVDRGSVESAENNEIICKVKAKSQGEIGRASCREMLHAV